jgi:hypothetical protein
MTPPVHNISSAMAQSTPQTTSKTAMGIPTMQAKSKEIAMHDTAAQGSAGSEAWKQFSKTIPFLGVPPEIHLKIFTFLNPIDAVCLSLVKYVISTTP